MFREKFLQSSKQLLKYNEKKAIVKNLNKLKPNFYFEESSINLPCTRNRTAKAPIAIFMFTDSIKVI